MSDAPGTRPDGRASGARGPGRRRVLEAGRAGVRPGAGGDLDGAPRWVGGLLAGLQGALLSLLVVVLPAVAAYVATSATPATAGVPWTRALQTGSSLWLLAHGVPLTLAPSVTLRPLGLTALALFSCYASARRSGYATRASFGAGVGGYVGVVLVVGLFTGIPLLHLAVGLVAGALVAGLGLGAGLLRRPEAPRLSRLLAPVLDRVPHAVERGVVGGLASVSALVGVAAALATVWVVSGRGAIGEVVTGLGPDAVGGIVLGLGELAYMPTLVVWALAWLAGPGFQAGLGTSFTAGAVEPGALPAIPLLGALPAPDVAGGFLRAVPVLLVVVGALVAARLRRGLVTERARDAVVAGVTSALAAGLGATVLGALARGGIGPGRMTAFGPSPVLLGLAVAAGVGLGALLVLLPADAHVRAAVAGAARRAAGGTVGAVRGVRRGGADGAAGAAGTAGMAGGGAAGATTGANAAAGTAPGAAAAGAAGAAENPDPGGPAGERPEA